MHELGIVFHITDSIEKIGREQGLTNVSRVTLEIGEVSGIVHSYLTDCWSWTVKKSVLLKDSELDIEEIKAVTVCEECNKEYETVTYAKICPYCHSDKTHLVTGNEIMIKEIEAC